MTRQIFPALLTLCLLAPASRAQQSAADLIPQDASFALVVKDLEDLRKKGEKFFDDNDLDANKVGRPTQAFKQLFKWLGIEKGVGEKGSAALVLPSLPVLGIKKLGSDLNTIITIVNGFVLVIPVGDLDEMARNFNLKAADLPQGKVVRVK